MAAGEEEAGFEEASASCPLPVERASVEEAGMTRLLEGGVLKREGELSRIYVEKIDDNVDDELDDDLMLMMILIAMQR